MCLSYNKNATDSLRDKLASGPLRFYKLYRVSVSVEDGKRSLLAPHQRCKADVVDGIIRSNRVETAITSQEQESGSVSYGIHVYATRPIETSDTIQVLEVTGLVEDLVGASSLCGPQQEAVFTKISVELDALETFLNKTKSETEFDEDDDDDDEDDYDDDDYDEDDEECLDCGSAMCDGECLDEDDDDDEDDDEEDD